MVQYKEDTISLWTKGRCALVHTSDSGSLSSEFLSCDADSLPAHPLPRPLYVRPVDLEAAGEVTDT